MVHVVTRLDLRAPGADRHARAERYRAAVAMARYAEETGHDSVNLSEHHGAEDGYLPSPLPMASAIAAVTLRIGISVWALVAPLYEPVRLAEDMAVLDHLSRGRVNYTFGLGYRPVEYALHSVPWDGRGSRMEELLEVLLAAWAGEPVGAEPADGAPRARVTPPPYSRPHPLVFLGGGAPAARRAARLGLHFQPQIDDPALAALYRAECARHGREPGLVIVPPTGPAAVFCAEDPDAFWDAHGGHLVAEAVSYRRWQEEGGRESFVSTDAVDAERLRAEGRYLVVRPEELVERCLDDGLALVCNHPLCGGLPPEAGWESMRLLAERVLPRIHPEEGTP